EFEAAGTLGYMAPEILKGIANNQRSDLYSLGVILHEILTGEKPSGTSVSISGVPEDVNNLLGRLVSSEIALRPTIPELYQTLKKYAGSFDVELSPYQVRLPSTGYVEVEGTIAILCKNAGETIIMCGDTGLGKTRLLQELKFRCLMDGNEVVHHQATQKSHLLDDLRRHFKTQDSPVAQPEDKYYFFEDITQAIIKRGKQRRLVIAVDDIDTLSDYELALFRYIGYGIKDSSALLIGTSKPNDSIAHLGFRTVQLAPFTETNTKTLLERTYGAIIAVDGGSANQFATWLHRQTGGNPLFIDEVLKVLYDKAILCYRNNQWQVAPDKFEEVQIPHKVIELVTSRVDTLTSGERRILNMLALADHPLQLAVAGRMTDGDFVAQLESLKNIGLIQEFVVTGQRMITVTNKIVTAYVVGKMQGEESQSLRRMLIKAIEDTVLDEEAYAPLLGKLQEAIKNAKDACRYYQIAAKRAEEIYDYQNAVGYYERVRSYNEHIGVTEYATTLIRLGDINQILGDSAGAKKYYSEALEFDDADMATKAYTGLGKIALAMGKHDDAISCFQRALSDRESHTSEFVTTANQLGYVYVQAQRYDEAETIFLESIELARSAQDHEAEADTLYYLASLEWYTGNFEHGIKKAAQLLHFCENHKLLKLRAFGASLLGSLHQQQKNLKMARHYFNIAIEAFQKINRVVGLAGALNNQASLFTQEGKLKEAYDLYTEALQIAKKTDNKSIFLVSMANVAALNSTFGRINEAIDQYDRILGADSSYVWAIYGRSIILLETGRCNKAREILQTAKEQDILIDIGQAAVSAASGEHHESGNFLRRAIENIEQTSPYISVQIEAIMRAGCLYFELKDYQSSSKAIAGLLRLVVEGGREYCLGKALWKMLNYVL
ncbi:tetratricopeptide repeat protein, partial [candidate division WOR-3 bacterium]|nr:tetratricopeptide repeat protein [candidate division WOR-3 bacterium]